MDVKMTHVLERVEMKGSMVWLAYRLWEVVERC